MEIILILISVAAFGLVHTLLASYRAKLIAQKTLGKNTAASIYRLVFNLLAVLSLTPALYLVVTLPDRELYRFPEPLNYLALIIQALAGLGVVYSVYQLDVWFFAGLRQLIDRGKESIDSTSTAQLVTNGLHRYVRHPLYTTSIVFLWLSSPMTLNRLTLIVCFTLYFYIGSIFEERKLVREFGEAYRQYQRDVPRLMPRLKFPA
jgi:protein-S-isoprenylcysteine O-methyltransferase Ste14